MSAGQAKLHAAIAAFDGQCALLGDARVDMAVVPERAKLAALGAAVQRTGLLRYVGWESWQRVSPWRTSRKAVSPMDARQGRIVRTRAPLLGVLNDSDICQQSGAAHNRMRFLGRAR